LSPASKPNPDVVRQVLGYFMRHPQAADDLEGIARWRLVEDAIQSRVEETHRALTWLVDHGYLVRTEGSGVSPVFSLNRNNLEAATALLKGAPGDDE
jgi:hypothetical protein